MCMINTYLDYIYAVADKPIVILLRRISVRADPATYPDQLSVVSIPDQLSGMSI